ncbi:hypothetical protein ACFWRV_06750 [Streptomyces sp. NPDC058576]|uniref:hypothetical protein n=1 Tax=Streptomyces sp. NPDC058576 TaxID=3346547 RepID=UPI003665D12A
MKAPTRGERAAVLPPLPGRAHPGLHLHIQFVTHNLDNARIADRIIVLDRGRIVETGTFQSLLDTAGLFAELHKLAQDR